MGRCTCYIYWGRVGGHCCESHWRRAGRVITGGRLSHTWLQHAWRSMFLQLPWKYIWEGALIDSCVGRYLVVLVSAVVFVEPHKAREKSNCGRCVRKHHTFGLRGSSPPSGVAKQTDIEPFYCIWREDKSLLQIAESCRLLYMGLRHGEKCAPEEHATRDGGKQTIRPDGQQCLNSTALAY